MATTYLGAQFDIHGGGLDLIFPHHENEIAQSVCAGDPFARYWMHNAWVTVAGAKMSKSLGNSMIVSTMLEQWRPVELRYYLVAPHYRSNVEYSPEALAEAAAAYRRIENFLARAAQALVGHVEAPQAEVPDPFAAALDDDLGMPAALAVLHETVRHGNAALTDGDEPALLARFGEVVAMTRVLGLLPPRADSADRGARAALDALVPVILSQRQAARDRKDYGAADQIRDALDAAGVLVEDTPAGPRWTLKEG